MTKRALLPLTVLLCATLAAQTPPAAPKAATPPDQRTLKAAVAIKDPEQKLTALRKFLVDYPDSTRKDSAHEAILTVLLEHFPDRTAEVDTEAKYDLKGNKKYAKWSEEVRLARRMAAAEPAGADLPLARKYANDALKNETEPKLTKVYLGYFKKPEPAPKPAAIHTFYANLRAAALTASAYIDYRQGNLPQATAQLDQAYALAPLSSGVNALRGDVAYAQHHNADALTSFERAQVSGSLPKHDRALLAQLYTEANPNGDLQATLDARYRELYPAPFNPPAGKPVTGGHTALLELYTGSGCPPCVGGDLAVEALLETHPRTELVALAYDLHIPDPDPLTSPDTVARAAYYKLSSTPNYVLDGKKLAIYGASRDGEDELYTKLLKVVDAQTAKPSAVQLQLTATPGATIAAEATVTLPDLAALASPSLPVEAPDPNAKKPAVDKKPTPAPTPAAAAPAPATPHYVLNFALVEDDVRYSGENGVRFHRMVVRALAKPSATGFSLTPGKTVTLSATFDPAAITTADNTYLDGYEKSNERFGPIEFLSKPTTLQPSHLAIAAWVQDADTRRVLQSAFYPLNPSETATR